MKPILWSMLLSSVALMAQDPPSRVARLNFMQGPVSFQPGTLEEWAPASRNYPLTTGDRLYTDDGSLAELQIGSASVRLAGRTNFSLLNLDDRTMQVGITSGAVNIRVRDALEGDIYEVDTPNGAVALLGRGEYRIDCDPDRNSTVVTVRSGEAELMANGQSYPVRQGESGYFDESTQQVDAAMQQDEFDRFAYSRDRREEMAPPSYVSREMIGWEDLNDNGSWRNEPEYGNVWIPRVSAGWAPYRDGHWAWVAPWGWTWVDDEPWGFAPFHYGRWAYLRNSWGWIPGPVSMRPVYAPALVAFLGGGFGFGGGDGVGWFPLGPRDVYVPSYYASRNYVNQVNITNVRNINVTNINYVTNNITNVNSVRNVVYANQQVPGAVTAVSRNDFMSSRPLRQVAMPVPLQAINRAQIYTNASVTPQRASVLAAPGGAYAPRPPAAVYTRAVMARVTPPPPPVPFQAAQRLQAAMPGRAPEPAMLRQMQQQTAARPAYVRPAFTPGSGPAARTGQYQTGTPRPAPGQMGPIDQQRRQTVAQPNVDSQRQMQMERQRQVQVEQQQRQQPVPHNADAQRQMQMERERALRMEQQQRQQQVQQNQDSQRQMQMERQRQIQVEQQQRIQQVAPNADAQRQRQIQAEQQQRQQQGQQNQDQQRQMQMERQRQQSEQQQRPQQREAPPARQQPERKPAPAAKPPA